MSENIFSEVILGKKSTAEIKKFLLDLKKKGETSEDITQAAQALLNAAKKFPRPDYEFGDLVGTGGDESGTVNISTAAALVAAQMGLPIAKHGNKSVSSKCGSADVLINLGANLELSPENSRACLDQTGFCFLLAPVYHPGMKHAMKARKELAARTIFNLLGPLVNPARPSIQLTGVYDPDLCRVMAETLQKLGCKSAMVVHGSGLDEIAIHGSTKAVLLKDGTLSDMTLQPLRPESLESLKGGNPKDNAAWLVSLLKGKASNAQNQAVGLNAGTLIWLQKGGDWKYICEEAIALISSGKCYEKLDAFITYSKEHASASSA